MATVNKPMLRVCRTDNCFVTFPEDLATVWIMGALRYIEVSMWNFFSSMEYALHAGILYQCLGARGEQ